MPEFYQTLLIKLSDGRTGYFTCRPLLNNEEIEHGSLEVERMVFTHTYSVPDGDFVAREFVEVTNEVIEKQFA